MGFRNWAVISAVSSVLAIIENVKRKPKVEHLADLLTAGLRSLHLWGLHCMVSDGSRVYRESYGCIMSYSILEGCEPEEIKS